MSAPTPDNLARAETALWGPSATPTVTLVAEALDAAELRGHTRAVNETAIASIHKAVAAERAAIVACLRAGAAVADHQIEECRTLHPEDYTSLRWERETCINYARQIEAGDHHPKENE